MCFCVCVCVCVWEGGKGKEEEGGGCEKGEEEVSHPVLDLCQSAVVLRKFFLVKFESRSCWAV